VLVDVAPGAHNEPAGAALAPADDAGDLVVSEVKDVVKQEDGALDRREPLERKEECHRKRVGLFGVLGGVDRVVVG
jgi:hypothetical protein